ncbi:MAG: hypothetical protein H7Z21_17595 [Hymenobacter sp.]|nr:hypothetical protein [Hymenobacter sp.]
METRAVMRQFQQLPADAQRVVAELIELLSQQSVPSTPVAGEVVGGATTLPPPDLSGVPATWPENEFMNPEFYGAWADREDSTDSTEYVRELRRNHWGTRP